MAIEISLTDFVEFVIKSGSPKLTIVKQIKNRTVYHPSKDYWKKLRDKIQETHSEAKDKDDLDKVIVDITDNSKLRNYKEAILAYKKFLGKKKIKWFNPPFKQWKNSELMIRLNPELGLIINNEKYVVKLYFKAEPITKNRIEIILSLLKSELKNKKENFKFALLDIRTIKLHTDEKIDINVLQPLLIGEAISFETIWKAI